MNDKRHTEVHDDVIKWKHFPHYWSGHRWIPLTVTRSFDVFFDLRLNKRLNKQSRRWWFETSFCSLWRQCNCNCSYLLPLSHRDVRYRYLKCESSVCRDHFNEVTWTSRDLNRMAIWLFVQQFRLTTNEVLSMGLWLLWWPPTESSMSMVS